MNASSAESILSSNARVFLGSSITLPCVTTLLTICAVAFCNTAQAITPNASQMAIFNSLDPAQQQAILQGVGGRGDQVRNARKKKDDGSDDQQNEHQQLAGQFSPTVLQPDDTVLIEIDFPHETTMVVPGAAGQVQVLTVPAPVVTVPLSNDERGKLRLLIEHIRAQNPYHITPEGAVQLPGFAAIPVAGLTIEQATARLAADPALLSLQIKLTLLPLQKMGVEGLKPFGYDLFSDAPSTFAPVTDVPVPADYVVGIGDELLVQLYGNQNRNLQLVVGNDGKISFPELGPINVVGKTFSSVQKELEARVTKQMIGVRASVSMGEIRTIRIFVLGEANFPGSYTVSGLATITSALFASGGVKPIGSLRTIQLKRQGALVRTLDLYDLLLHGDTSNDAKLLAGDVIFISPVGVTVAIDGEVQRPAIYELKGQETIADLITLAGGLTAEADVHKIALTRLNAQQQRIVSDVQLATVLPDKLQSGAVLSIARIPPTLDVGVTITGHLFAPRVVAWREGLRLTDVVHSVDELKPNADIHYLLIRRELPPDRTIAVRSADLGRALEQPGGEADIELLPRDQITVFDFAAGRSQLIQPIINELHLQSRLNRPTALVRVSGQVKVPGEYPLEPNMRVSDLLRAGGNLKDAAYTASAELTRYSEQAGARVTQRIEVDLAAIARGDMQADMLLQSEDYLIVQQLPRWRGEGYITLRGEVQFPGRYPIQQGETLGSVIKRAGGLTESAFATGSVFTRENLRQREQQQIDALAARLQSDLAALALKGSMVSQAQSSTGHVVDMGASLLAQLKQAAAVGRLVIDLDHILSNKFHAESDVLLQDGDVLFVPKRSQSVTVIGEVQSLTSHLYKKGLTRSDYIGQSGGLTPKADRKHIYVVRANGSVIARTSAGRWFQSGANTRIQPGDTIVVPLDTERMPALPLWQAVTQIIYNLSIAAAAVNSF